MTELESYAKEHWKNVVLCKECKYAHITYSGEVKYCDIWFPDEKMYLDGDYYCASGERASDERK